ncbi:MAG: hypothetical protein V4592_16450 [Bacteroidota bacterium]
MKAILLFLLVVNCKVVAQKIIKTERASRYSVHVIGDNFEGLMFKKNFFYGKDTAYIKGGRFTLSFDEIILTETLLKKSLYRADLDTTYDNSNAKVTLRQNLDKYVHQYYGFLNNRGEKIVMIICFYKLNVNNYRNKKYWYKKLVFAYDGGAAYWHIKINLVTEQPFDFWVNGR